MKLPEYLLSTPRLVLIMLSIAICIFTYLWIIEGKEFLVIAWTVFWYFFGSRGSEVADWQTKQELVYKIQDEIKNDQKQEISTEDMPISYDNLPPDYPYYETTETNPRSI